MDKIFYAKSKRLAKYLYSLGFPKESEVIEQNEIWKFQKSNALQEALDFYFYMREKNR